MHNSDAISILNCAFDSPCFFTQGPSFFRNDYSKLSFIGCVSKHLFLAAIFELQTPANDVKCSGYFDSQTECLCVPRQVVLWSKHLVIRILVPVSYLKLCNQMYIYIYIYIYIIYIYIYCIGLYDHTIWIIRSHVLWCIWYCMVW